MAERHGQHASLGVPGDVAVHADRGDEPGALLVAAAHLGPQHPRRHHANVARELEAVERERVAAGDDHEGVVARRDRQRGDHVVGDEHAQHVGVVGGVEVERGEAVGLGRVAAGVGPHADDHVEAGVAEVERPRPSLVAIPDHGDAAAGQGVDVSVVSVEDHTAQRSQIGRVQSVQRDTGR